VAGFSFRIGDVKGVEDKGMGYSDRTYYLGVLLDVNTG
jgi:hypothetical protein